MSPIAEERSDLPSPKRQKLEETNCDDSSSDDSKNFKDYDTPEAMELFNQELRKSGGFEFDFSKLKYNYDFNPVDLDDSTWVREPETNRDYIVRQDETPKSKANGSSSLKCPMLNDANYTVWAIRIKIILKVNKVWEAVEPGNTDDGMNNMAIALIFQSIPDALILQAGEQDTAKGVWEAIKARHVGAERVKEARLQTLMAEFDKIKMKDGDKIDTFAGKLSEISSKSAALGEVIEESKLVKKFLKSLPRTRYIHIVASLEQVLDLNTTTYEDIVGRLKAYEERIGDEEDEQ